MSDMHRGNGTSLDDFAHNSLIYKCALSYYLENGFTYIELGDAEELWENRTFDQIYITHTSIYEQLAQFHDPDPQKTRYIKIYGNHDLKWRYKPAPLEGLFPGIIIYEAALLDNHILMWHGHQADPSCLGFRASIAKFFVGGFGPGMQRLGFRDSTRAANNPGRANETMNLKGKKILVTEADGFIGSHLTEALLDVDCHIRALSVYINFNIFYKRRV